MIGSAIPRGDVLGVKGRALPLPFTMLPNTLIRDGSLSSGAFRLLAYLASYGEGWEFRRETMLQDLDVSPNTYQKQMKELRARGLVRVIQERDEGGQLGRLLFIVDLMAEPQPS